MKSYTDIEQSKVLAKILPIKSADMYWKNGISDKYIQCFTPFVIDDDGTNIDFDYDIPCWSLIALIELLPSELFLSKHYFLEISKMGDISTPYEVRYYRFRESSDGADFGRITYISYSSQNLVDACVAMIEYLHKLNLL